MSNWNKTTFNHTLITSQFLNDLQDYIMGLEDRIIALEGSINTLEGSINALDGRVVALEAKPQLIPYDEHPGEKIPTTAGVTASLTLQGVLMNREVVVGDILVGSDAGYLCEVTATDGQFADVVGIGYHI